MPDGSELGLPVRDDDGSDELSGLFADSDENTQPEEVEAPETDPDAADATPPAHEAYPEDDDDNQDAPQPIQVDEEEEEGTDDEGDLTPVAEEGQELYAGRYQTIDAMEQGYREIQGAFTQTAQQNAQLRADLQSMQEQSAQIIEYLQLQAAEGDPEVAAQIAQQRAIQEGVQTELERRVQPLERQMQEQSVRSAAQEAINGFYARHPDVPPGSEADRSVTQAFHQLRGAGVPLDPANPEHLEVAYEALADPAFGAEVAVNPGALRTPGGLAQLRARSQAQRAPSNGSPNGTQPKRRGQVRRKVEAHVETGSGAPVSTAPGKKPVDEFDEAWDYYQNDVKRKGVLFGSPR